MPSLKRAMRWNETVFGFEYDMDIYLYGGEGQFLQYKAMENKGINVFNAKYVLARAQAATYVDYLNIEWVIGHEYFYNWNGNHSTCHDWF